MLHYILFTVPMGEVLFCFPSGQCQAFLLYSRIERSENKIISYALVMPTLGRYYVYTVQTCGSSGKTEQKSITIEKN